MSFPKNTDWTTLIISCKQKTTKQKEVRNCAHFVHFFNIILWKDKFNSPRFNNPNLYDFNSLPDPVK